MARSSVDLLRSVWRVLWADGPLSLLRACVNQVAPVASFEALVKPVRARWPDATAEDVFALLAHPANRYLVQAIQVRVEFARLLRLYADLRPRRVLEIGTAKGGTLFAFTTLAGPGARVISLDYPTRQALLVELPALLDAARTTTILVTHDPAEALALASRAVALHGGRVAAEGAVEAVLAAVGLVPVSPGGTS